jgi:hypothetical protein
MGVALQSALRRRDAAPAEETEARIAELAVINSIQAGVPSSTSGHRRHRAMPRIFATGNMHPLVDEATRGPRLYT